jgi:hypothetical protein
VYAYTYMLVPLALALFGVYRLVLQSQAGEEAENAVAVWAARNGYQPGGYPSAGATPTLSMPAATAGEAFQVPLGETTGSLFLWSWVVEDRNDTLSMATFEVTVVQAMLAAGFPHFRVVPRHGWTAPSTLDEHEVQLESVEFSSQFKLLAGRDGDQQALVRLFDPATIVWFITLGDTAPVIEYQLGTLAVVTRFGAETDVELDALVEQARHVSERVLAEGLLHNPAA